MIEVKKSYRAIHAIDPLMMFKLFIQKVCPIHKY